MLILMLKCCLQQTRASILLGEKLDGQTQAYIRAVRDAGGVITTDIASYCSWKSYCSEF